MTIRTYSLPPGCFFCGCPVADAEARLTGYGKVYGPCCADLFTKEETK